MEKRELLTFIEAVLFIIGAVLLVLNIATGRGVWFIIGLSLAAIAVVIWIVSSVIERRNKKTENTETAQGKPQTDRQ
jgi:O-antigen/teichoic acid export membrane protein